MSRTIQCLFGSQPLGPVKALGHGRLRSALVAAAHTASPIPINLTHVAAVLAAAAAAAAMASDPMASDPLWAVAAAAMASDPSKPGTRIVMRAATKGHSCDEP
jgi:hypothetical protein